MTKPLRWVLRAVLAVCVAYATLFAVVLSAMLSGPERFGLFMKHMPPALVWGALPAQPMWLWARGGTLSVGDMAPDFELPRQGESTRVRLSSFRGAKPVVLVFGSYT